VGSTITFRPAVAADARLLLDWRNEPAARGASFQSQPIELAEHEAWLAQRLSDPDCALMLIEDGGEPSGSVRLERQDDETATIHVVVAPQARGRGLASRAVCEIADRAGRLLGVKRVVARVKAGNVASLEAFRSAGFTKSRDGEGFVELSRLASSGC
jgi:UDP-2,4-diacetamido-2,4,6-trideoxy-beta-L-altropyranose hydrolase